MATFFVISLSNNFYSGFNSHPSHRISLHHIRKGPSIHLTMKKRNSLLLKLYWFFRRFPFRTIVTSSKKISPITHGPYTFQSRYHQYLYTNIEGYSIQTTQTKPNLRPAVESLYEMKRSETWPSSPKIMRIPWWKVLKIKGTYRGFRMVDGLLRRRFIYIYIYMVGWGFLMRKGFVIGRCLLVGKRNPGRERSHALTPPYILASFCLRVSLWNAVLTLRTCY